jgi:hypothetical protein
MTPIDKPLGRPPSSHRVAGTGSVIRAIGLDDWVALRAAGEYDRIENQSKLSCSSASSRPFGVYPWMANPS